MSLDKAIEIREKSLATMRHGVCVSEDCVRLIIMSTVRSAQYRDDEMIYYAVSEVRSTDAETRAAGHAGKGMPTPPAVSPPKVCRGNRQRLRVKAP